MKNFRTPLILFVVLAALSGVAYWDEWKTKTEDESKKTENKLFSFDANAINEIELSYLDNEKPETIKLFKEGESWQIIAPVKTKAEKDEITNLVKNVREYSFEKKVTDDKNKWGEFGLDQPRVKIVLKAAGSPFEFSLGSKAPVGYSTYVAIGPDNSTVFMGSQYIDLAVSKKLFDLRQKNFAELAWDKLSTFEFQRPGQPHVALTKSEKGWQLNAKEKADEEELKNLVSALNTEIVASFLDQPSEEMQKAFAPNNKATQIIAKLSWLEEGGEKKSLTFLSNNNELYAAYDPSQQIFRLNSAFKQRLAKDAINFQYRRIFSFSPENISSVTLDGKKFARKGDSWLEEGQTTPANHIALLLTDLSGAKTDRFDSLPESTLKKLGAPTHRIALEGEGQKFLAETWVDKTAKDKHFLRLEGTPTLYRVDAKVLTHTNPQAAAPNLGIEEDHGIEDEHDHDHG